MKTYPAGLGVTVPFQLTDANGDPVVPTSLSFRVEDENGLEIVPDASIPTIASNFSVMVDSIANALSAGAIDGLRNVIVSVVTNDGTYEVAESYIIKVNAQLVPLVNSFQTLEQAMLLGSRIPGLENWGTASRTDRVMTLMESFTRLTRFTYRINRSDGLENEQDYLLPRFDETITPLRWAQLTDNEWNSVVFARFRLAICRAQIMEANDILGYDPVADRRSRGLLSETIGESSMMFRSGKPLDLGIAQRATDEIRGFLYNRMTLTRI